MFEVSTKEVVRVMSTQESRPLMFRRKEDQSELIAISRKVDELKLDIEALKERMGTAEHKIQLGTGLINEIADMVLKTIETQQKIKKTVLRSAVVIGILLIVNGELTLSLIRSMIGVMF